MSNDTAVIRAEARDYRGLTPEIAPRVTKFPE